MYDPTVGRFLEEDPKGFAAGDANLNRYVGNNPLNYTDPSGTNAEGNTPAALYDPHVSFGPNGEAIVGGPVAGGSANGGPAPCGFGPSGFGNGTGGGAGDGLGTGMLQPSSGASGGCSPVHLVRYEPTPRPPDETPPLRQPPIAGPPQPQPQPTPPWWWPSFLPWPFGPQAAPPAPLPPGAPGIQAPAPGGAPAPAPLPGGLPPLAPLPPPKR